MNPAHIVSELFYWFLRFSRHGVRSGRNIGFEQGLLLSALFTFSDSHKEVDYGKAISMILTES
jgi:hypothetical protein